MTDSYDVIVIGVGAMGASACWHLAQRSLRVLGLERFDIPNTRGSSHGFSRMIRMAYYEHPDYVPLLRRAYANWDALSQQFGAILLHRTGGLYIGPRDGELIDGSRRSARQHALPHDLLDHSALAARFPQFILPDDHVGLLEPQAGYLLPERCIRAMAETALRHGAEIHAHEAVLDWRDDSSGVRVRTDRGEYRAQTLVFCGGAWSEKLVRDLGVKLTVTRQVLGWVWPRQPKLFEEGVLPVWAIDRPDGSIYYGFPIAQPDSDGAGFKLALHQPMAGTDPDQVSREITPADEQTFRECLCRFLPQADGPVLGVRTCLYTNSPDHHFLLDRHPRHARVLIACGFSGHGFKFASVIGEALADLATAGTTALPIDFLNLSRFRALRTSGSSAT